jgi:hypothetical protein
MAWTGSGGGISPNGIVIPTYQKAAGVITAGNKGSKTLRNITSGSNGTYSTIKGYDLVTGWGSPNGAALMNALAP